MPAVHVSTCPRARSHHTRLPALIAALQEEQHARTTQTQTNRQTKGGREERQTHTHTHTHIHVRTQNLVSVLTALVRMSMAGGEHVYMPESFEQHRQSLFSRSPHRRNAGASLKWSHITHAVCVFGLRCFCVSIACGLLSSCCRLTLVVLEFSPHLPARAQQHRGPRRYCHQFGGRLWREHWKQHCCCALSFVIQGCTCVCL